VRYGSGIKDEAGNPAFALVNKATGEALKHSFGHCLPVKPIFFQLSAMHLIQVIYYNFLEIALHE
jgi:hypothetical protein